MNTWNIKGFCENCGFAYKGTISSWKDGSFPNIACPKCHKRTDNFNESHIVDNLNKQEASIPDYKESVLEIIS